MPTEPALHIGRKGPIKLTKCLFDRQPVRYIKSLNGRQFYTHALSKAGKKIAHILPSVKN